MAYCIKCDKFLYCPCDRTIVTKSGSDRPITYTKRRQILEFLGDLESKALCFFYEEDKRKKKSSIMYIKELKDLVPILETAKGILEYTISEIATHIDFIKEAYERAENIAHIKEARRNGIRQILGISNTN